MTVLLMMSGTHTSQLIITTFHMCWSTEGVFQAVIDGLQAEQDYRREVAPEVAEKVCALDGETSF